MKKEEFEKILKYRIDLKNKITYYRNALNCEHEYGNIEITKDYWSEAICSKCGEGFGITHSEDGSVMSSKHINEENKKKKSLEDIQFFRKRLNEVIEEKIKSIENGLREMRIFVLKTHPFSKPKLTILKFDGGGIGYQYYDTTLIIDSGYKSPNRYYFYDGDFKVRAAILSTYKPDEWMDANRNLKELK